MHLGDAEEQMQTEDHSVVAVIPLYNGARWIESAVRSVIAQTLPADEFIIVDDGSMDEGPAIVRKLAAMYPQIRLVYKTNGGQSSARNMGARESKSKLIALLDQDDEWYPHHLEELVKPFHKRGPIPLGWVYGNLDHIDDKGGMVHRNFLDVVPQITPGNHQHPKRWLSACLGNDMFVLPGASLISRTAFEAVGGFDERLAGYEDDDLFLRLFRAGFDNIFINKPVTKWRLHSASTSYGPRMQSSRMIYARKLIKEYPDRPTQGEFYVRDLIAPRFMLNLLGQFCQAARNGNKTLMESFRQDMRELLPRLSGQRRIKYSVAITLFAIYPIARLTVAVLPMARRVLRFI
jgi:glycosyltransferase involved in cell wall biosynthesis